MKIGGENWSNRDLSSLRFPSLVKLVTDIVSTAAVRNVFRGGRGAWQPFLSGHASSKQGFSVQWYTHLQGREARSNARGTLPRVPKQGTVVEGVKPWQTVTLAIDSVGTRVATIWTWLVDVDASQRSSRFPGYRIL